MDGRPLAEFPEAWVDELCDQFEKQLKSGAAPRIEETLQQIAPEHQAALLRELLLLEFEFIQRVGGNPHKDFVLQRFPLHEETIDQIFQARCTAPLADSQTSSASDTKRNEEDTSSVSQINGDEADAANRKLGPFDLLSEIGVGGMGVVYRALQRKTKRIVALKVLRAEYLLNTSPADRREVLTRFENEVIAASQLDHDHIVTIYDVGQADGRHYYSMQYIEGESLAAKVAQGPLPSREAAQALEPVARALQEAHAHGIVHRDVKPANLLVDGRDGRIMVTDFGLAKLRDTECQVTMAGAVFGSPPYMSPEQTQNASQVNHLTDVYSLGATLYHLLTGRAPFQAATPTETMQQVVKAIPALPSEVNPNVHRDLETICMKCLEKEPHRRYQSAGDLADELSRFLTHQPIRARRIGQLGRLWRWCLRNQLTASVLTVAGTLLTIFALLTLSAYWEASELTLRESHQRRLAQQGQKDALRFFGLAQEAVDRMVVQLSEDEAFRSRGLERQRREQLLNAREFYAQLAVHHPKDINLLHAQSRALYQLATIHLDLNDLEEARAAFEQALRIQQNLRTLYPDSRQYQREMAATYQGAGSLAIQRGQFGRAFDYFEEALQLRENLLQIAPDDVPEYKTDLAETLAVIGGAYERRGLLTAAQESFQRAYDVLDEMIPNDLKPESIPKELQTAHSQLARVHSDLGRIHSLLGNLAAARTYYQRAVAVATRLSERDRHHPQHQETLAVAKNNLGDVLQQVSDYGGAEAAYDDAHFILDRLVRRHPDVIRYQMKLAVSHNSLASLFQESGRPGEAREAFLAARDICRELVEQYPSVPEYRKNLAEELINLGLLNVDSGDYGLAVREYEAAATIIEQLCAEYPLVVDYQATLATCLNCRANLHIMQNEFARAQHSYEESIRVQQQIITTHAEVPDYRSQYARTCLNYGFLHANLIHPDEAAPWIEKAIAHYDELMLDFPETLNYSRQLAFGCEAMMMLLRDEGRLEEAVAVGNRAAHIYRDMVERQPADWNLREQLAEHLYQLALLSSQIDPSCLEEAAELWTDIHRETSDPLVALNLGEASNLLAEYWLERDKLQEAKNCYDSAVQAYQAFQESAENQEYARHLVVLSLAARAHCSTRLGEHEAAVKDLRVAVENAADAEQSELTIQLAEATATQGRLDEALGLLQTIDFHACRDPYVLLHRALRVVQAPASESAPPAPGSASEVGNARRPLELLRTVFDSQPDRTKLRLERLQDEISRDEALASLRNSDEFQAFVQEVSSR